MVALEAVLHYQLFISVIEITCQDTKALRCVHIIGGKNYTLQEINSSNVLERALMKNAMSHSVGELYRLIL